MTHALLRFQALPSLIAALAVAAQPTLAAASPPELKAADLALLDRVSWGVDRQDAEAIAAQGRERWLNHQLHPDRHDRLPAEVQARIDAMDISRTPMAELVMASQAENKAANDIADPEQKQAARKAYQQRLNSYATQAAERSLLRDLYSPDQLQEQMTWFWMNHFNVHQSKGLIRAMVGDYEDRAIRPHALGKFRDLLAATLRHPAMLQYLDNAQNAAGHINENYAREIMELHTMGVGSGYTQGDVQELARILTGVGVNAGPNRPNVRKALQEQYFRDGLFEFNPNRHDYGDKVFLGHKIAGRGFVEVDEALDILARQPATARYVSKKLATYFVGDAPPEALVARMAETFRRSDGDIAQVLDTLFRSPEFRASLGGGPKAGKFKDPVHYVISAVRLGYDDRVIANTRPIQNWLNRLSEGLYNHETPDGYSLTAAAWNGPGQMAVRFEVARQIGSGPPALFTAEAAPAPPAPMAMAMAAPGMTAMAAQPVASPPPAAPAAPRPKPSPPPLRQTAESLGLVTRRGPATQAALAQAASPVDWNTLFLSSPEFMRR